MFGRAFLVFVAVLVTGALTVGGADATNARKFRVVIQQSGSVSSAQGRFVLYAPASTDSGTSALRLGIGLAHYRGGQHYHIDRGVDTLNDKKGSLELTFTGPSVNAGPHLHIQYGTWRISNADGIYEGWQGGGNWGATDNEQTYHVQLEGLVTG